MSIRLALTVLAIALAAWVASLARSWDGWYGMNHATGTVTALADAALHGESPGRSGGPTLLATVYFPPFPLAVAGLRHTGMSWHAALRWASLLSALALVAATFAAALAAGGGAAAGGIAVALLVAMFPFKAASLAGRADLLAAAFSIGALAAWTADREQRGWATAVLAALAWLTKASALTVPVALGAWALGRRQPVPAARFAVRLAAVLLAGVLLTLPFHGPGWYAAALRVLFLAAPNTSHVLRGPAEFLRYAGCFAELAIAAAIAVVFLAAQEMRGHPLRSFSVVAFGVAMVLMANRGSDHNHLLELAALAAVATGVWGERLGARAVALPAVLLLLAVPAASWRDLQTISRLASDPAVKRAAVVAAVRAQPGTVFTEDPLIAIAAGRRAAVSDPALLRSLVRTRDPRARAVVQELAAGRWDLVVLDNELEYGAAKWYREFNLGPEAVAALRGAYEPAGTADNHAFYRPRSRGLFHLPVELPLPRPGRKPDRRPAP
jgi:hypothetical protein